MESIIQQHSGQKIRSVDPDRIFGPRLRVSGLEGKIA